MSAPDEPAERKAHAIAQRVMATPWAPCLPGVGVTATPSLHRPATSAASTVPLQARIEAARGLGDNGRPLSERERADFEPRLGRDLSRVRVHQSARTAAAAQALKARAFTIGFDIGFGGAYRPDTDDGRKLMAHELVHTLQDGDRHTIYRDLLGDARVQSVGEADLRRASDSELREMIEALEAEVSGAVGEGSVGLDANLEAARLELFRRLRRRPERSVRAVERPDLEPLADLFNRAFAPIVFALVDHGTDRVSAERLAELFTNAQIARLERYLVDNEVPDGLFTGQLGRATAQQRILLSAHILATGEYRHGPEVGQQAGAESCYAPGQFPQRVHGRFCGHWVNLVYTYAGVSEGLGRGVREQFGHSGHISPGVRTTEEGETVPASRTQPFGPMRRLQPEETPPGVSRADWVARPFPMEQVNLLEAGDWIYIFNDNGPGGGNHSVIFVRFTSGEQTYTGPGAPGVTVRYREAITYSQGNPESAGRLEHHRLIGDRFVARGFRPHRDQDHHITPVVMVARVDSSTRPVSSAEDVEALMRAPADPSRRGRRRSSGRSVAERNARFIQRRLGRDAVLNGAALLAYIREQNDALITRLARTGGAGREAFTEEIAADFRRANEGIHGASVEEQLTALVRQNELLNRWITNAEATERGVRDQAARVEAPRYARLVEAEERQTALERRLAPLRSEREAVEAEIAQLVEQQRPFDERDRRLRQAVAERRRIDARLAELRLVRDQQSMTAEVRAALAREREHLQARRIEVQRDINETTTLRREHHGAAGSVRSSVRRLEGRRRRLAAQEARLQTTGAGNPDDAGYYTAHGRVDVGTFQGREEARQLTGLLENLRPEPDWARFAVDLRDERR